VQKEKKELTKCQFNRKRVTLLYGSLGSCQKKKKKKPRTWEKGVVGKNITKSLPREMTKKKSEKASKPGGRKKRGGCWKRMSRPGKVNIREPAKKLRRPNEKSEDREKKRLEKKKKEKQKKRAGVPTQTSHRPDTSGQRKG